MAEQLGDLEYQLVSLVGLYAYESDQMSTASQMLSLAGRYSHVAQVHADPSALARGDALIALPQIKPIAVGDFVAFFAGL